MTDNWIIQDIEKHIAHRNRVVILDPTGQCSYLLPIIEKHSYTILKTDNTKTEEWQTVQHKRVTDGIYFSTTQQLSWIIRMKVKRVTDGIYFSTTQQQSWIIRMKVNKYDAVSNNPSPCSAQGNAHPSSLRGKA